MDYASESLKRHYDWKGKIEVICRCSSRNRRYGGTWTW